ncbi:MAG: LysE family transporter, partial [Pseudomonadota bacterium]
HMFGVGLGFMLMVLVVGVGVVQLLDRFPLIDNTLTVICVVYLLYLAYRIARAANVQSGVTAESKPLSFIQAAMFQWVNPKTWTMAVTANSLYAPDYEFSAVVLVASVFGLVNFPCIAIWTILGTGLRRLLTNPTRLTTFNYVMAGLLILSVLPLLTWPGSTQS